MNKNKFEGICRSAGLRPVSRGNFEGAEIFIADGFSLPPHAKHTRFEIYPGEHVEKFPGGMYVTFWWASRGEDQLDFGRPIFFDLLHNPEYANGSKQLARINSAMNDAVDSLRRRKRIRLDG